MKKQIKLKAAFYAKNDWERLLLISDDRDKLEDTWEKWYANYLKAKKDFLNSGIVLNEVRVNIDELIQFCKKNNLKIDGAARSMFAQQKEDNYGFYTNFN